MSISKEEKEDEDDEEEEDLGSSSSVCANARLIRPPWDDILLEIPLIFKGAH